MVDYINNFAIHVQHIIRVCADAIEEINDGDERPAIVLSLIESVYSLQLALRAEVARYPKVLENKNFYSRYQRIIHYRPENALRRKYYDRVKYNSTDNVVDDLPF